MFSQLFGGNRLGAFQIADLGLIGLDDGFAGGAKDTLQQCVDLLRDVLDLLFAGCDGIGRQCPAGLPGNAEHRTRHLDQFLGGLQRLDDLANLSLDLVARDGLAIGVAGLRLAEIVGIVLVTALRPGRPQRHATTIAADEAA
ncbi:MAG: hypothetical protein AAF292_17080 [Pseudomonadota bacterium]